MNCNTKPKDMEEEANKACEGSELLLNVRRSRPRFKAGAELSNSVNMVDLNWREDLNDDVAVLEMSLHLKSSDCPATCPQTDEDGAAAGE
jgi:hypothetical protein